MNKRQRKKVLKKQLTTAKGAFAIVVGNKFDGDTYPYHHVPIGTTVLAKYYSMKTKECVPYKMSRRGAIAGSQIQLIQDKDLKFI